MRKIIYGFVFAGLISGGVYAGYCPEALTKEDMKNLSAEKSGEATLNGKNFEVTPKNQEIIKAALGTTGFRMGIKNIVTGKVADIDKNYPEKPNPYMAEVECHYKSQLPGEGSPRSFEITRKLDLKENETELEAFHGRQIYNK